MATQNLEEKNTDRPRRRKLSARCMNGKKEPSSQGDPAKKVKSRKQAIAIGLSEARKSGAKVPKKEK